MPGRDGTGPVGGMGRRGMNRCGGNGMGRGLGMRNGQGPFCRNRTFYSRNNFDAQVDEKEIVQSDIALLEAELKAAKTRLSELN